MFLFFFRKRGGWSGWGRRHLHSPRTAGDSFCGLLHLGQGVDELGPDVPYLREGEIVQAVCAMRAGPYVVVEVELDLEEQVLEQQLPVLLEPSLVDEFGI